MNFASLQMPRPYIPEFDPYNIPPELAEFIKNFKIRPNKFKPRKKIRQKRHMAKLKPTKEIHLTGKQLAKFKSAKTSGGKMGAIGMKGGTRAIIDIKKKLIDRLAVTSHRIDHTRSFAKFSERRKLTEALADHLAGETIVDAALRYGIQPAKLAHFKGKFLKADSALPQYVEELFMSAAVECIGIFHDKKHTLTGMQAVIAAGILAERSTQMKKARSSSYQEDVISLSHIQKLADVMDRLKEQKKLSGRTIETEVEIKQIEE